MEQNGLKRAWVLFGTEMWEKFTFYGMRTILPLFTVHFLGFSEADAAIYYGAFLALSYLTPVIGGALADRFLGYGASVIIGAALLSLSQLIFFTVACGLPYADTMTLIACVFSICGNGFFKPSVTSLLSGCFYNKDKLDAAFSTYYFFLNSGVLLGQFIVPFFGDKLSGGVRDISAFKWGFSATFAAMITGLVLYVVFGRVKFQASKQNLRSMDFDKRNFIVACGVFIIIFALLSYFSGGANLIKTYVYPMIYACGISIGVYVWLDKTLSKIERKNISTIFISAFFIVFFWATFEQAGTSLTFIANNQTDRRFLGFELPPSMIQSFNPLFVLVLSLPFAALWDRFDAKRKKPENLNKQAFGLLLMGLSYLVIAFAVLDLGQNLLSVKWFVLLYFMQTCAEMTISPIGFALVGKLSPKRFLGLIYGVFYLANAAGYALAGILASLMPPTADKFIKARELGINLRDLLDGSATATAQQIEALTANNLPLSYPKIFGFYITDLFDFFMIFFLLCVCGGAILFVIAASGKFKEN